MSKRYSIAEARDNLAAIVHELDMTHSIEITRRGQPVAVLLSKQEYDQLQSSTIGFWDAYKCYTKQVNLAKLKIDPSDLFGGLRDAAVGRKVEL